MWPTFFMLRKRNLLFQVQNTKHGRLARDTRKQSQRHEKNKVKLVSDYYRLFFSRVRAVWRFAISALLHTKFWKTHRNNPLPCNQYYISLIPLSHPPEAVEECKQRTVWHLWCHIGAAYTSGKSQINNATGGLEFDTKYKIQNSLVSCPSFAETDTESFVKATLAQAWRFLQYSPWFLYYIPPTSWVSYILNAFLEYYRICINCAAFICAFV